MGQPVTPSAVAERPRSRVRLRWTWLLGLPMAVLLAACGGTGTVPHQSSGTVVSRFGVVGNRGAIAQLELSTPTVVSGISGEVVQIATSNSDGYALTSTGAVWAWGVNVYGELGDGTASPFATRAVKVDFPAGVKITSLANPMPFDGALAIDSYGHAWGWGLNLEGDLCLTGLQELRPGQLPLSGVTLATGALTHSLFDSDGQIYACGSGTYGVLGNGTTTGSPTPTAVVGLPSSARVTALTSSWGGAGALLSNGSYYNWGYNDAGQLGNGSTTDSDLPVRVGLTAGVREVFQGGSGPTNGQTIAILTNGSVWMWGNNAKGQLGNGSRVSSDVPVKVDVPSGVTFVKVNSGGYSSYAIDNSGRLWAWGGNQNGQLGTGTGTRIETHPVDVGVHLTQVSSTASNVAAFERNSR
ncbi:MAG: RCC1-like domain-containing protein [Acidimicrobiales bacterium]